VQPNGFDGGTPFLSIGLSMECVICDNNTQPAFRAKIIDKYDVQYYLCAECDFLRTEHPFWLDEVYSQVINDTDTGILSRNISLSKVTAAILFILFDKNAKFMDYAGGYGIFVRLMRDIGFDYYWHDPYSTNLFARGFEYNSADNMNLLTSFESFEHFVNPLEDIEKMLAISQNLMFTTELLPSPLPKPSEWWYYGLEHGQHISFYSQKTLTFIAKKYNLNFHTNGKNIHLYTDKKINSSLLRYIFKHHKNRWFESRIKKIMKSKTFVDMEYLIDKINACP